MLASTGTLITICCIRSILSMQEFCGPTCICCSGCRACRLQWGGWVKTISRRCLPRCMAWYCCYQHSPISSCSVPLLVRMAKNERWPWRSVARSREKFQRGFMSLQCRLHFFRYRDARSVCVGRVDLAVAGSAHREDAGAGIALHRFSRGVGENGYPAR